MSLRPEERGIDIRICGIIIRLVVNDVFIRVPKVGVLAWNPQALCFDRWEDVKHEPLP